MKPALIQSWDRLLGVMLLTLLVVAATQITAAYASLSDFARKPVVVQAGVWNTFTPTPTLTPTETPNTHMGTRLAVVITAIGFSEISDETIVNGVRGQVCVQNEGKETTQGLEIKDIVQIENEEESFEDFQNKLIDVSQHPALASGESYCYPYEITFLPREGAANYRNTAIVTIINYFDWMPGNINCPDSMPCPFGPIVNTDFELPKEDVSIQVEIISTESSTPIEMPTLTETSTPTTIEPPATETPIEPAPTDPPVEETPPPPEPAPAG